MLKCAAGTLLLCVTVLLLMLATCVQQIAKLQTWQCGLNPQNVRIFSFFSFSFLKKIMLLRPDALQRMYARLSEGSVQMKYRVRDALE